MTNPKHERKNYSEKEVDKMLKKAEQLPEYFRLRAQCLVALAYRFGKRRIEMSRLLIENFTITETDLEVEFTLAKKRKRGLHQYLKHLETANPTALTKPLPELREMWREWQQTNEGHKITKTTALKSIDLRDKYAPFILNYLEYVKKHYSETKFLFPSGYSNFGNYTVEPTEHISGSQLLRILKILTRDGWLHLFRATKGEQTARRFGRTLESLHNVASTLNISDSTAMHYIEKYVPQKQPIIT